MRITWEDNIQSGIGVLPDNDMRQRMVDAIAKLCPRPHYKHVILRLA